MAGWDDRRARKARLLLRPAITDGMGGRWADIGCGDGIFTRLLLEWLTPGSTIVAVDQDRGALRRLDEALTAQQRLAVQAVQADFAQPLTLPSLEPLDGVVLANSLHFVRQKLPVLATLVGLLRPGGTIIIIEYNADRGHGAVPYPLRAETCLRLLADAELQNARIVAQEPSSFLDELYTAMATR